MSDYTLEDAARELCQLRGVDPDQKITTSPKPNKDGTVNMVAIHKPYWMVVRDELKEDMLKSHIINKLISNKGFYVIEE